MDFRELKDEEELFQIKKDEEEKQNKRFWKSGIEIKNMGMLLLGFLFLCFLLLPKASLGQKLTFKIIVTVYTRNFLEPTWKCYFVQYKSSRKSENTLFVCLGKVKNTLLVFLSFFSPAVLVVFIAESICVGCGRGKTVHQRFYHQILLRGIY